MNLFLVLSGASGFVAVAAGAFGAHALKTRLPADLLGAFETGARYQMYHALALGLVAFGRGRVTSALWDWSGWMFLLGTLLFSGSLYVLALTGTRAWGAVTPLGGLALLAGWALFVIAGFRGWTPK
jgi:uncharacterized membrane protein YgdD (TMEM256/DUF423 family)